MTRNGDFSAGGEQWNVNASIPSTWNPFVSGAANLYPPNSYNGEVIYQNLNVTGVGGKTLNFSCTMTNVSAPAGKTIAFYVDYIDTASGSDKYVSEHLYSPNNASITSSTPVTYNSFVFPVTARKLVKFRVVKEGAGEFVLDDIQLAIPTGIVVGTVPRISSLSSNSGNYGSSLTISGTNFGASQGKVTIGGGPGATISSWSDTHITATVADPARSGRVVVVSDFSESNSNNSFAVTSPNFTVDLMAQKVQFVKGQFAEFVLKTKLLNGFSTTTGINFAVSGLPGGTVTSFSPVPVKKDGGTVLRIATGNLAPGVYDLTITASEALSADRVVNGILTVTTTNPASFSFNYSDGVNPSTPVTNLSVTGQKQLVISPSALDNSGSSVSGLVISSSNPLVLGTYKNNMGYYDVYSLDSGSANLIATAPDGVSASLPITITVPADQRVDISLTPDTITNKYVSNIQLSTTFNFLSGQWYGTSLYGMITIDATKLDFNSNPPPYYYGGTFTVDHSQTQIGTYLFSGSITTSFGGSTLFSRVAPLTITNDSSYAGLNVALRSMDASILPMMYEQYSIEFYNDNGVLQFSRSHASYDMNSTSISLIGAIPPGSYKIKFVPMSTSVLSQWYPNGDSAAKAQLITFTAGVNDGPRYFFARKAPDTTAPFITQFTAPVSSSTLQVSGIILNGYDNDSGVAAYCLTETNDSASCAWQLTPPTTFTFAASGNRTLYAFIKDAAGNVSVTNANSTLQINIVLEFPLTLVFAGTGGGQVNGAISCVSGYACSPVMFPETPGVSLVATPDIDSTFGSWSGCTTVSGTLSTTCNVTVNAAKTVTATFVAAPKVKIAGGSAAGFPSLRQAYDAASTDAQAPSTIQVRSIILPDTAFSFDRPISVTVKGGYDSLFSTVNAGVSTIAGSVTFKGGPVTVEKLAIR